MDVAELLDRITSLLFPQRCLQCDEVVEYDDFLCDKCPFDRVGQVTLPFPNRISGLAAILAYSEDRRGLIWKIKDSSAPRVYHFFANEMHRALGEHWGDVRFDFIVPVPTTQAKLDLRGYNQVDLLIEPLSKLANIPILSNALRREEDSQTQHDLSKEKREENAEKSYQINDADAVRGKTILLADDLLTTGYTASVCANRLLDAGAAAVYLLSAAATPLYAGEEITP